MSPLASAAVSGKFRPMRLAEGLSIRLRSLAILTVTLLATSTVAVTQERVLYSFNGPPTDGAGPAYGSLIFDAGGNLYGTTGEGGVGCDQYGCGTVFELTPDGNGGWTETVLYYFDPTFSNPDGVNPLAGLALDNAGNLYGTTSEGVGGGKVFELLPDGRGGWTETLLHTFGGAPDGATPQSGLIFDNTGNLYGTTYEGGTNPCGGNGCGTVFRVVANGGRGLDGNRAIQLQQQRQRRILSPGQSDL